jgi:6-phosphofructokinase 1
MTKYPEGHCPEIWLKPHETDIPVLGKAKIENHLVTGRFIDDDAGVLVCINKHDFKQITADPVFFQEAGPREHVFFDPSKTKCAVVTCGGLCPGLNDVIRAIVLEAYENYDVVSVIGVRYGLEGFIPSFGHSFKELTPENVEPIHEFGGTILGTSRGPQSVEHIVDTLERMNVNILFMIGGDGTMRAAQRIVEEISSRNLKISLVGVPKTIDNDISFVARSFGFDTAVDKAGEAIRCAHAEAVGAPGGIGMVKLMGRDSGHIAAQAALNVKVVDFVLVPEDPFEMEGEKGLLAALERKLDTQGHAVVVVAEGAGVNLLNRPNEKDESGNKRQADICGFLIDGIKGHFKGKDKEMNLKFIDPSYIIRSVQANSNDRIYCGFLGQNAVHAAMAGKTACVVGRWNGRFVHIPLELVTRGVKKINPQSNFWRTVIESTGQPVAMRDK